MGLQSRRRKVSTTLWRSFARSWGWIIPTSLVWCFLKEERNSPVVVLLEEGAVKLAIPAQKGREIDDSSSRVVAECFGEVAALFGRLANLKTSAANRRALKCPTALRKLLL